MANGDLLKDDNVEIKYSSISLPLFSDISSFKCSNKRPVYLPACNEM